jgi:hypothetical protein
VQRVLRPGPKQQAAAGDGGWRARQPAATRGGGALSELVPLQPGASSSAVWRFGARRDRGSGGASIACRHGNGWASSSSQQGKGGGALCAPTPS